jgi:hypothetical protein
MPNPFGGCEQHSSYTGEDLSNDPYRWCADGWEYKIDSIGSHWFVMVEHINGRAYTRNINSQDLPTEVQRKIQKLLAWERLKQE